MNRKSKVIVSIVGITIVALALLGITYAYYLTRIEGNTNTNSISITTADLKLTYDDGNEIVTENNIMPGTTIGEKTFIVSNTGNSAVEDYKVVLEYAVIENVVPSVFVRPQDFEITLTCVSKNIQTNNISGTCSGYTGTWNNESFEMTLNDIAENIKHEYTLTIFYANPDIDQSDDMGKNLNLKVQIYGANETSTITGTVDDVDETYAMRINSNPKISTIKNIGTKENPKYQYKFIGVEHNKDGESHTLTLINKSNVEQSTGNITIKKGTTPSINGSTITVKDNQTNIYLTSSSGSSELTSTASFNPYSNNTNSLAYHIINNAMEYNDNDTSTILVENKKNTKSKYNEFINYKKELSFYSIEENYVTYATDFEYDKNTKKFNLKDVETCSFKDCYQDLVGKYYIDLESPSTISNDYIYQIMFVEDYYFDDSMAEDGIYFINGTIYSSRITDENYNVTVSDRHLSITPDDYGNSYYYNGAVLDNFLNFAGMCWRIVRIDGAGNIKIILADKQYECDSSNYKITNDNSYIDKINWIISSETGNYEKWGISQTINNWMNSKHIDVSNLESNGEWCNDISLKSIKYYDEDWIPANSAGLAAYVDLIYNAQKTSFKCDFIGINDTKANKVISHSALLTAAEAYMAGDYLYTNLFVDSSENQFGYLTMTPVSILASASGYLEVYTYNTIDKELFVYDYVTGEIRPALLLKKGTILKSGNGTQSNPYVIE